jgi:integrase
LPIKEKIEIICKEIYGAEKIEFSNKAFKMIKKAESLGFGNLPICISKTQKSISDNPSLLGAPKNYTLNIDEINKLKDEVKENFFVNLFVEFALCTGGRLETILHIQKKDIDLDNKTVNLNNLKTKKRYTGFLQDELIAKLREYLPSLNANDYVVTQKGLQEKKADHKQIHRRLKPILDKLFNKGLKDDDITNRAVIHTLRHSFASHLAINGTPIFTIQKLMNHSDIKQTLRYAKLAPDSGKNDVQGLYK